MTAGVQGRRGGGREAREAGPINPAQKESQPSSPKAPFSFPERGLGFRERPFLHLSTGYFHTVPRVTFMR